MSKIIEGIMRCVTPLHSATESVKDASGANVTKTAVQSIFATTGREEVPYYKATSQRGGLRRNAARVVLDRLTLDKQVSRQLFTGMMTGSESGQPDTAQLSVEEAVRARKNIFMGLFGGGARILRSRYQVSDMVPVIPSTLDIGMVPAHYGKNSETSTVVQAKGRDLVNTYGFVSVDDVVRVMHVEDIEKYIENGVEDIAAHQANVLQNKTTRKAEKVDGAKRDDEKTKKIDKSNMLSFEAIAPGVPLYFRLELDDGVSDAQVGLMTTALCNLINAQEFGGWIRAGFGRVSANLQISVDGEQFIPLFDAEANGKYRPTSTIEQQFIVPMNDALSKVTVEEMTEFYSNRG